jgi:hypothetical protein
LRLPHFEHRCAEHRFAEHETGDSLDEDYERIDALDRGAIHDNGNPFALNACHPLWKLFARFFTCSRVSITPRDEVDAFDGRAINDKSH